MRTEVLEIESRKQTILRFRLSQFLEYFYYDDVELDWAKLDDAYGGSDIEKRMIYLSPSIPSTPNYSLGLGDSWVDYTKPLKFKEGEQYFFVLLHEIGHFKITEPKIPKYFMKAKKELESDFPDDKDLQVESADLYIKQRKNEELSHWGWRIDEFKLWLLTGHTKQEHIDVETWAIKEFRKHRGDIRQALKEMRKQLPLI